MPCSTPTRPPAKRAACWPLRMPEPARLDADHAHARSLQERMEQADRVAAAADARDQRGGQPAFLLQDLPARLAPDDALEIADHHGIRVRAEAVPRT